MRSFRNELSVSKEGHTVSSFPTNGGDGELRTAVYPSNLAPIAAKLRQRAFQTICKFRFFDVETLFTQFSFCFVFDFSLFSVDFRGARLFPMSKSKFSRFFALDGQMFRSVRRLGLIFRIFTVRTWGKARATEIPEGGSAPPDPPRGQGTSNGDSCGGFAPPDPPTTPFQKICPSGANFLK